MLPGSDRYAPRLDEHERRLDKIEKEQLRVAGAVRDLEHDRKTIRLLADTTLELGKRAMELAESVDAIAERAVEHVLERHRERRVRELELRRANWRYRLGWIAAAASVAGLLWDHLHGF